MQYVLKLYFLTLTFFCFTTFSAIADVPGDVNDDGRIGLEDAIYALRVTSGIEPTYSNEMLAGAWISTGSGTSNNEFYIIFDEQGTVTELGAFNVSSPAGTYSLNGDGSLTMTLSAGSDTLSFTGNFTNFNEIDGHLMQILFIW